MSGGGNPVGEFVGGVGRALTGRNGEAAGNGTFEPRTADFNFGSYGANALGLDRASAVSAKLQSAFANPGQYYADRNTALNGVRLSANTVFENKFKSLRKEHFPDDECKARASNYTQAVMAAEVAEFEASWPLDVTNIAASLTAKRSTAGQGLMAIANSGTLSIPGAKRGRKSKK